MTGFNLPPGCNVSDIPGNRPEDMLEEAIAEGWRPRCEDCGGFLPIAPDSVEDHTRIVHCSGKPTKYEHEYDPEYDRVMLNIIGMEHAGEKYYTYRCECEQETGPEGHAPHDEHFYEGMTEHRICKRCGRDNTRMEY